MSEPVKRRRPNWGEPGSKVTRATRATVFSAGIRPVIVSIYPDGIIGLRLSRQRREEFCDAAGLYQQALRSRVAFERASKRKAKRSKQ